MEKFEALIKSLEEDPLSWINFTLENEAICPHCGLKIGTCEYDMKSIEKEGEHFIDCPKCKNKIRVICSVIYCFSTFDKQGLKKEMQKRRDKK